MNKKNKDRSHRYDIIDLGLDIYTNIINIKCLSMIILICLKQYLSNIWNSIQEKVKQHCGWVEKSTSY